VLTTIVLSVLALAGMGGLIAVCMAQAKTNNRLANKVIANSDHQLQRIAIEEGATMVRIGTAIFGPRSVGSRRIEKHAA
jgi:hypothetical protein